MAAKARVRWLCRRGMKELDVLLERFMDNEYDRLDPEEHAAFRQLLAMQDPDLYALIMGRTSPATESLARVTTRIRDHHGPRGAPPSG